MKKNTLLIVGGVIIAYYLWKKSQETSETVIVEGEEMSNGAGCQAPKVACSSQFGYHCVSPYQCGKMQEKQYKR